MCKFCPDTRGQRWPLIYAHLFSRAVGREECSKQTSLACVGRAGSVSAALGLSPLMVHALSQSTLLSLHPGCSARELSEVGPGLHALPRSKLLRSRFLGTPQKCRHGQTCVLCPSQVRAAQVTRCLASTVSPGRRCLLSPPQSQLLGFLGGSGRAHLRCAMCLFWELISGCRPPGGCQQSRIPRSLG